MSDNKKVRVNIYLPEDLVRDLDDLAKKDMFPRSTLIQLALKTYIDQQTMLEYTKLAKMHEIKKTTE